MKMRAREAEAVCVSKHHRWHKREFAWIKGKITTLILEDFVGATFGAMFFAVTQEVWDIAKALKPANVFAVFLLSLAMGFLLVYLSRRRKYISIRLEHAASLRAVEIYLVSFLTALLFVLVLNTAPSLELALKQTVVIALPAVISAATADLLFF